MLKDIYDLLMKLVMFAVFVVNLSKLSNDAYLYAALILCKFVSQSHSFTNLLAGSVSAILRPIKVVLSFLSSVRNTADHFSEFEKKLRISLSKMILCASNCFRQYVLIVKVCLFVDFRQEVGINWYD